MSGPASIVRFAAPYVLAAAAGGALALFCPRFLWFEGGALARLSDARSRIERLETNLAMQTAATRVSERLREEAQIRGVADADAAARACAARVERAGRDAVAISHIVAREVSQDAQGCPVRELIGADELRRIFDPDPGGDAAGVPAGSAG